MLYGEFNNVTNLLLSNGRGEDLLLLMRIYLSLSLLLLVSVVIIRLEHMLSLWRQRSFMVRTREGINNFNL